MPSKHNAVHQAEHLEDNWFARVRRYAKEKFSRNKHRSTHSKDKQSLIQAEFVKDKWHVRTRKYLKERAKWIKQHPTKTGIMILGGFLTVGYAFLSGLKAIQSQRTVSMVNSAEFFFFMGSVTFLVSIMIYLSSVMAILNKLISSESFYDETVSVKDKHGRYIEARVSLNDHIIQMTWGSRLILTFLTLTIVIASVSQAAIALNSLIPALTSMGATGVATLGPVATLGMMAPLGFIVMFCYGSLQLNEAAKYLARHNWRLILVNAIKSMVAWDAKEKVNEAFKKISKEPTKKEFAREVLKYRVGKLIKFVIFVGLMALAAWATWYILFNGLSIFAEHFPNALVIMKFATVRPDLTAMVSPCMILALVSSLPFTAISMYNLAGKIIHMVTHVHKIPSEIKKYATRLEAKFVEEQTQGHGKIASALYTMGVVMKDLGVTVLIAFGILNAANNGFNAGQKKAVQYGGFDNEPPDVQKESIATIVGGSLRSLGNVANAVTNKPKVPYNTPILELTTTDYIDKTGELASKGPILHQYNAGKDKSDNSIKIPKLYPESLGKRFFEDEQAITIKPKLQNADGQALKN